ncbi:MAG: preprotein translocase subunit YajC [Acidobacteria bacterium]|nr:preprotein translocase subunit YajC [Acidobacteriota bacterium]
MAILLPVALVGAMYFFLIRPQQQQMKQHRKLLATIDVGDEVVTSSGIYGIITEIEDEIVWLEVAQELELKLAREAIQRLAVDPEVEESDVDELEEISEDEDA